MRTIHAIWLLIPTLCAPELVQREGGKPQNQVGTSLLATPFAKAALWETQFAAAKTRAAKEKKLIYAVFLSNAGDANEIAAYENEALLSPWWIQASKEVVPYLHELTDDPRRVDQELEVQLSIDTQPIPCCLFFDATGRLLLDPDSPTAARSLPCGESPWRMDLQLARIHADLALILERHPEDPAAIAGLELLVAMHSEIVQEAVSEFDDAANQPKLDPRIAALWKEHKKIRPILEILDGVGLDASASQPSDPKAENGRRLFSLLKSGVTLPLDHRRAFDFHLAALEGARRAGDGAQAQLISDLLDKIVARSFRYVRADMARMIDEVKQAKF